MGATWLTSKGLHHGQHRHLHRTERQLHRHGSHPDAQRQGQDRAEQQESENAPDYRIVAGNFEIGAAWKKVSKSDRPYLSATLDDPSFPATIYARLVEGEDGAHNLIWSRSKGD